MEKRIGHRIQRNRKFNKASSGGGMVSSHDVEFSLDSPLASSRLDKGTVSPKATKPKSVPFGLSEAENNLLFEKIRNAGNGYGRKPKPNGSNSGRPRKNSNGSSGRGKNQSPGKNEHHNHMNVANGAEESNGYFSLPKPPSSAKSTASLSTSSSELNSSLYAGPTFTHSPAASNLPIPTFLNASDAAEKPEYASSMTTTASPLFSQQVYASLSSTPSQELPTTTHVPVANKGWYSPTASGRSVSDNYINNHAVPSMTHCSSTPPLQEGIPMFDHASYRQISPSRFQSNSPVDGLHCHSTSALDLLFHRDREQRLFRMLHHGSA
ncbi:Dcp2-Dcp1 mRNA-decapping complex subunit Edc1 [Schizosaccharomyces osmophilus]|uniref:Dcp2-Dcp1 mRNA-decapping complex subunit Edc1 n=1 Tax=Schizosaccharomyces osmophilus TaxID=2545709 RepID=A0AAF0AYH3_9SCHI|nr:Dcp2-Dcp1 mRNA-decapping complex subunit Edc1 [Schizosaccharomyces osmophilus]WBW74629.1 Dcp2-Dcp1 mRNA-decapping complex subunit Edc1 [Schizosaccharomyces osmophilus]